MGRGEKGEWENRPKRNGQNDIQGVGGSGFQGFGSLGSSLSCCTDPKHWASGRGHGAGSVYAYPLSAVGGKLHKSPS
ncbi:hypothetical protein V6N13_132084 [Hibiscus sabdariffa]